MSKKISLGIAITIALIAMAVTFSLTMAFSMSTFNSTVSSVKNKERQYNKLSEVDRFVRDSEYYSIDEDTLNDQLAYGYLRGIGDKNAVYYTAKEYSTQLSMEAGKLTGIGVKLAVDTSGYWRILRVYDNSPASEAGLEVGGFITAVDGVSTRNRTDTVTALLGSESTTTSVTYLTPDRQESTVELGHSNYNVTTVYSEMTSDDCGYLKFDDFAADTAAEFKAKADDLIEEGASCLVIDLRDVSSTNVSAALVCADYCVPAGLMAQEIDKDGNAADLRMSDEQELTLPIVCLVNGSTSNAAELFAYMLRKMGGAGIVGTVTKGNALMVSDAHSFSDGSAVCISEGLIVDADGETWNDVGLTPDQEVALTADEQTAYYDYTVDTDPQIAAAVKLALSM